MFKSNQINRINPRNILKKMTNVPTESDGYKTFIQYILDKLFLDFVSFSVITLPQNLYSDPDSIILDLSHK